MNNDFDYRGFGRRLRATRIALGLTEEEAAAAAGRTVRTWRKYEATGTGNCTGALLQLCKHHDLPLNWIVCGRVPPADKSRAGLPPELPPDERL